MRYSYLFIAITLLTPVILLAKPNQEAPVALDAAMQQARHQIEVVEGKSKPTHWRAHNASNRLNIEFDGRGVTASSSADDWHLRMELTQWGIPEQLKPAKQPKVTIKGNRLTYDRGAIQEWYINDPKGLEQGFTVNKPLGKEALVLQLALEGNVKPTLIEKDQVLQFITQQGETLSYKGLKAWDANGKDLVATMALENNQLKLQVETTNATFPITIDPVLTLVEEYKLMASDVAEFDRFGTSVALSGDNALVGAPNEDDIPNRDSGAAYIFTRSDGAWSEQAKLRASDIDPTNSDVGFKPYGFGSSVALSGDIAVIQAFSGKAYVFIRNGSVWTEQAKLIPEHPSISVESVALNASGDTVVLGKRGVFDSIGEARVFTRSGETIWVEQSRLKASDGEEGDFFANAIAISDHAIVVGAKKARDFNNPDNNTNRTGAAYVFIRNEDSWLEQAKLTTSDEKFQNGFGCSVAISGDTVVVGSTGDGSAYVFNRNGDTWVEQAKLQTEAAQYDSFQDVSVAIDGDTIAVGRFNKNCAGEGGCTPQGDDGSVYIFTRSGDAWIKQVKLLPSDILEVDKFGFGGSVALSGSMLLGGASNSDYSGISAAGSSYIFNLSSVIPASTEAPNPEASAVVLSEQDSTDSGGGAFEYLLIALLSCMRAVGRIRAIRMKMN